MSSFFLLCCSRGPCIFNRLSIAVVKHQDQKQTQEKRVYFTDSPFREVTVRTQQGMKNAASWLALPDLLSLFSYTVLDHLLKVVLPTMGGLHTQSSIKKMGHALLCRPILGRYFLDFFPDEPTLCQVDIKHSKKYTLYQQYTLKKASNIPI